MVDPVIYLLEAGFKTRLLDFPLLPVAWCRRAGVHLEEHEEYGGGRAARRDLDAPRGVSSIGHIGLMSPVGPVFSTRYLDQPK